MSCRPRRAGTAAAPTAAPVAEDLFTPLADLSLSGPKVRVEPTDYAAFSLDVRGLRRRSWPTRPTADAARPGRAGSRSRSRTRAASSRRFAVVETGGGRARVRGAAPGDPDLRRQRRRRPEPQHPDGRHPDGLPRLGAQPGRAGAWYVDPAYNRRGESRHLSYYGAAVPEVGRAVRGARRSSDTAEAVAAATEQIGPPDGAGRAEGLPARPGHRPELRGVLRRGQRVGGEGDADQPGQPGLHGRPGDPVPAGRRQRPAQPQHRGPGHRPPAVPAAPTPATPTHPARGRRARGDLARPQRVRDRPDHRRRELRHRPHRPGHQRRRRRRPRRRRRQRQGPGLHRPAVPRGRLLRHRLRRARDRPPDGRQPHLQRHPAQLRGAQPQHRHHPRSSRAPGPR